MNAHALARTDAPEIRARIRVRGQVQGVGFRPFVYRLARESGLAGWVRNDGEGVEIEVQGTGEAIEEMVRRLGSDAPTLARVDSVERQPRPVERHARGFEIRASAGGPAATGITPDTAVCPDCLAELFDPGNRRYRYPFINCTQCGPRYTLTARLPYDRPHTSMAVFRQCPPCQSEYDHPENRRFHAQPNACPDCGPELTLLDASGARLADGDPVAETLKRLRRGEIIALKGLGGFHLACDATNAGAVAALRQRKQREEKPFALMVAGVASLGRWVESSAPAQALLRSAERPIVLLRKRADADRMLEGVAPGLAWLGIMLPYTPLHYLLFHEAAGRPEGLGWLAQPQDLVLVMTSANPGGEPLVTGNGEALGRLHGIADAFLTHNRDILVGCDDSVVRCVEGGMPQFIRRARGWTPRAIKLARSGPSVLAVGGWFKNTVCVTRGDEAYVSQHVGDLDNAPTCVSLENTAAHLMDVLQVAPEVVAHDLHPDFHSTRFACDLARERNLPLVGVQHHHAHVAAVAAEHRLEGPVLGLALDGVGLGADGGIWGGELLLVDGAASTRLGRLRPLALPGGDRAAREPWRMAASALHALGRADEIQRRFPGPRAFAVRQMLESGVHAPETSSAGRLFDAAAGLLGLREHQAFEGQAPMLLEGLADAHGPADPLQHGFRLMEDGTLDFLPLLGALAEDRDQGRAASVFHSTLTLGLARWVLAFSERDGIRRVVFGGGCFLNRVLAGALGLALAEAGLEVCQASQVPPNDGGLSLGQAWIAIHSQPRI